MINVVRSPASVGVGQHRLVCAGFPDDAMASKPGSPPLLCGLAMGVLISRLVLALKTSPRGEGIAAATNQKSWVVTCAHFHN